VFLRNEFLNGREAGIPDVRWLRPEGGEMDERDWHDRDRKAIAVHFPLSGADSGRSLLILLNASAAAVEFALPRDESDTPWRLLVSTHEEVAPSQPAGRWMVEAHSAAILESERGQ
jgi:glycogen operon protein